MAATNHKMIMLFFFFLLLQVCCQLAFAHSAVNFLPGFQGPLPFELETGYVGVGDSEEVQLFYYFIKSERKPEEDPLLLWLTGGPVFPALSCLVFETGPLKFEVAEYNGSLPTLVLNPYSWTKVSNIIFVDSPVGTGFSYARNKDAEQTSDTKQVGHLHQFLLKWLKDHADFISNPFYLSGDSYAGIPVPVLGQDILNGNERGVEPIINLQGYILGNPKTVFDLEENSKIPYAHRMGLISDELYESLERNCNAEYLHVDPCNQACLKDIQNFEQCTSRINHGHILEPCCGKDSTEPGDPEPYLGDHCQQFLPFPPLFCRIYAYYLCRFGANDDNVRKALHIRKGSIGTWQRCNSKLFYNKDVPTSFPYHANLSTRGYRALIYSGDHDMAVPYFSTQEWIRLLSYSIVDDWRPWTVQGQVAGYTRTYSNRMTFATVKGGGHTAPEYKPAECLAMLDRWISGQPL